MAKLGGNKSIYFADSIFQEEQGLIYSKGKSLEEVINEINKVGNLFRIDRLYDNYESIYEDGVKLYGFYEEINSDYQNVTIPL